MSSEISLLSSGFVSSSRSSTSASIASGLSAFSSDVLTSFSFASASSLMISNSSFEDREITSYAYEMSSSQAFSAQTQNRITNVSFNEAGIRCRSPLALMFESSFLLIVFEPWERETIRLLVNWPFTFWLSTDRLAIGFGAHHLMA